MVPSKGTSVIFIPVFLLLCYFAFFLRLTSFPILMWDESRTAVNAFEMLQNKNIIVTHFEGKPDLWATKPPLLIWLVALTMKLLGYNELALRLPSAFAGLALALFTFFYTRRTAGDTRAGFITGLVLITSTGFLGPHITRTGDYDSLLILWTTLFAVSYFHWLNYESAEKKYRSLLIAGAAFALAFLTKSAAVLMLGPGLLLYTLLKRKLEALLTLKTFAVMAGTALLSVTYFIVREQYNPGYIKSAMENDFIGRYFSTIEAHTGPFHYYFENFFKDRLVPWIYIFPLSAVLIFFLKDKKLRELGIFSVIMSVTYFLLISLAKTKLIWYDAALYPFVAIVTGLSIWQLYRYSMENILLPGINRNLRFMVFIVIVFFMPYRNMVQAVTKKPLEASWEELQYGSFFKKLAKENPEIKQFSVMCRQYNAHLLFHTHLLNSKGYSIDISGSDDKPPKSTILVTCAEGTKSLIQERYEEEVIQQDERCACYKISNNR